MNLWSDPDWDTKHPSYHYSRYEKWWDTEGTEILAFLLGIAGLIGFLLYC